MNEFVQIQEQKLPTRAGGGEGAVGPDRKPAALGSTDQRYRGWLPSGIVFTPGEILAAVLVAEIGWVVTMVSLTLTGRLAELPELAAGRSFVSALLFGLACGLYVLIRLRSRRLAWRKHLRGER